MKVTVLRPVEVNVVYVDVTVPVLQRDIDNGGIADDCPGLCDGQLRLRFNLDTKTVEMWPSGKTATIHLKVRDEGIYRLLDSNRNIVHESNYYVPAFVPNNGSDYFACNIAGDGSVTECNGINWRVRENDIYEWLKQED